MLLKYHIVIRQVASLYLEFSIATAHQSFITGVFPRPYHLVFQNFPTWITFWTHLFQYYIFHLSKINGLCCPSNNFFKNYVVTFPHMSNVAVYFTWSDKVNSNKYFPQKINLILTILGEISKNKMWWTNLHSLCVQLITPLQSQSR